MFQVGLGYRRELHQEILDAPPGLIDFVELAPENYVGMGGEWRRKLALVRAKLPVLTHGFSLSLGGTAPLDGDLIEDLGRFCAEVGTRHHSDHACWSSMGQTHLHELLPVPFTRELAARMAARVREVASSLPVPFAVENVSSYARYPEDTMGEADFMTEVLDRADAPMLLDVNNILVNAINFKLDPFEILRRMPAERAVQIHVAGFWREREDLVIDTHGEPVDARVWPLLEEALRRTGPVPVLLERDHNFPAFSALAEEIGVIRGIGERVFGREPEHRDRDQDRVL
ncbi:MAG: DUF692 domain-containing protein [Myxococcota bacterium]